MAKKEKTKHAQVSLNVKEAKQFLKHIIDNNRYLQQQNKPPVAVEVIGDSGIGKTSTIVQLANELDLNFVKLNLAQIEELGDLVGFPIRQFEVCQDNDKCLWIDEHAVDEYTKQGFKFTGKNRMSYCPPEWISGKSTGGILLLDDWNRADIRFIQAVMELIDRQQYISWELPKDWHIILTSNPDNGDYLVNSIDNAQKTRFISINLKFDINCWSEWAEDTEMDNRCINFLLKHPELVSTNTNSRSISTFFNSISSLKTFDGELGLIQMIGEGSVGSEFTTMFTMFINNKLDKIISPETIMNHESEEYILNTLKGVIGKEDKYRADLASILSTRIVNYSLFYSKSNKIEKSYIDRLAYLMNEDIFAVDLKYKIVKSIYNGNSSSFKTLMMNKTLIKFLSK
jgi:hypothetical protein